MDTHGETSPPLPNPPGPQPFAVQGPIRVVVEQAPKRWRWVRVILSILIGLALLNAMVGSVAETGGVDEKYHSLARMAFKKFAIINVDGVIMSGDGFVKKQIEEAEEDERVQGIILRVESPGGTITGSDAIYHRLKKLLAKRKLPMVVSMGSVAASGGYYIAMAGGETERTIFAEPTTWTGSIGVIIPHYDLSGLLERFDVKDDSIASHRFKQMGSVTRKLNPDERAEERKMLQEMVDVSFADFKSIVLASRKELREHPDVQATAFTGRVFTAKQAKEQLLVDEIGFVEDAIDRLLELTKLDRKEVMVVEYQKPLTGAQRLFGASESRSADFAPQSLISELAHALVPRPYYLCSLVSPLSVEYWGKQAE